MLDGFDVSEWQRSTPSLAGQSFAFARAVYGARPDVMYPKHLAAFRAAGVVAGAYAFGVGAAQTPIAMQAAAFLKTAHSADILVLDVEANWLTRADGSRYLGPTMTPDEARAFIKIVHAAGRKIGLYHSRSGFPSCGQDFNWIAQWTASAPSGISWAFWQISGSGIDRDKFNGDLGKLRVLAGLESPPISAVAIATLRRYIANLAGVRRPIAAQITELALYRKRLIDYLNRNKTK